VAAVVDGRLSLSQELMKNSIAITLFLFAFSAQAHAQDTTRISLLFAGDVMGHDSQIASAYDPVTKKYDYASCFKFIAPYVQSADLALANLEVTLAGRPYKGYPAFSSPDALAVALKDMGFDALVTANNHCVDRGKKGLERTIRVLDSLKIPHTGTFTNSESRLKDNPLMLYKNGFSIAVLNYTYGTNGLPVYKPNIVNMLDTALIRRDLVKTKELKPDVIVVFTHWGGEYQSLPSKTQKDLTEFCFRQGAQLVIGAHPHVLQPMEFRRQKNQFVAYSLGNFVSGQRKRYTDGGAMAYLELEKITHKPDSAITTIDSVGYHLLWVHRTPDASQDYFMIPASGDSRKHLDFIKSPAAQSAYKLFLQDSRLLFRQHNQNIGEIAVAPTTSQPVYSVLLLTTKREEDPWKILTDQNLYLWGVDRFDASDGKVFWTSGKFRTFGAAERYRQKCLTQHKDAIVLAFKNGVPEIDLR
jgi:poly-gamma-glutamate capsule biosynthesis protein CapA/YwtB (metallophosphatase superfamily)